MAEQLNLQDSTAKRFDKIRERNIVDEMKTSYINYAMSVIVARALPDVRDGLTKNPRVQLETLLPNTIHMEM